MSVGSSSLRSAIWSGIAREPRSAGWRMATWSRVEQVACGAAAVALAPGAVLLAASVAIVSRRSPFVSHKRVGSGGRSLWIWKLRTMWSDECGVRRLRFVERLAGPWVPGDKLTEDPRVTHPLARWMRRYSIDEIPQIMQVAMGQLALVGPRPLTEEELEMHYGPYAAEVLSVKPGLTGLWQVMGRNRLSYAQRRRLDVFLARRSSLRLRLWVLWKTVPAVMSGRDAG
jgi:lipopolysaccharide/colanic/teichoic acid biosynthesis glycosyltransferase